MPVQDPCVEIVSPTAHLRLAVSSSGWLRRSITQTCTRCRAWRIHGYADIGRARASGWLARRYRLGLNPLNCSAKGPRLPPPLFLCSLLCWSFLAWRNKTGRCNGHPRAAPWAGPRRCADNRRGADDRPHSADTTRASASRQDPRQSKTGKSDMTVGDSAHRTGDNTRDSVGY